MWVPFNSIKFLSVQEAAAALKAAAQTVSPELNQMTKWLLRLLRLLPVFLHLCCPVFFSESMSLPHMLQILKASSKAPLLGSSRRDRSDQEPKFHKQIIIKCIQLLYHTICWYDTIPYYSIINYKSMCSAFAPLPGISAISARTRRDTAHLHRILEIANGSIYSTSARLSLGRCSMSPNLSMSVAFLYRLNPSPMCADGDPEGLTQFECSGASAFTTCGAVSYSKQKVGCHVLDSRHFHALCSRAPFRLSGFFMKIHEIVLSHILAYRICSLWSW